ncbi:3-keto-disaccharide hydrolase [Novipirellula sp. SH528]|uniref:3-keto-disaccharide hydrolase n=1 Tax=Novipirellula sp. SH528 TaxID=3454466 RepID=UPI003F9FF40D
MNWKIKLVGCMTLSMMFANVGRANDTATAVATPSANHSDATAEREAGFVSLFDGKTLDGWKKAEENPDAWVVEDGKLVCKGERCHLFYVGDQSPFRDFHFKAEVMTTPGSNAGIYFATKYQPKGWPRYGYECQVNVSHHDPKKTSSLYSVDDVADPGVKDNEWYTQEIIVKGRHIELRVNGKTLVDYTEPEGKESFSGDFERRLNDAGTFALQAHDPQSVVYFRNLRVKKLDADDTL